MSPKGPFSLKYLATIANAKVVGQENILISNINALDLAKKGELSFLDNNKYINDFIKTNASACIISEKIYVKLKKKINITYLLSEKPYYSYALLLKEFYPKTNENEIENFTNIEIDSLAKISNKAVIKSNVIIKKNTLINSCSSIGPNVIIGKDCYIGNNVNISNTSIGDNVVIQDGCVIGQDGFGYAYDGNKYIKVPQIGIVNIENNVEIGANCTIDRGSLKNTEIRNGVKIDNLVHIAHNVIINDNTMIAGQTGIAGSTIIGRNVLMGGQVGIAGHLLIEDNVNIGAQSGITKNISKNKIVSGTPAVNLKTYLKQSIYLKNMVEKK